jgi:CheY-like chemotaxis protein
MAWIKRAPARQPGENALEGSNILWIDDHPEGNSTERRCFAALGMTVTTVESTQSALACLANEDFDLILSDVDREGSNHTGLDALPRVNAKAPTIPIILYIAALQPRGVPHGAFGITNRPDELLHLCMDALERHRL